MSASEKVVLERDDLQRTLRRIAHEIAEKNPVAKSLAIVGIHTRGAILARRLHGPSPSSPRRRYRSATSTSPSTVMTRGKVARRTAGRARLPHRLRHWRKTVVLVDDVLFTGRTVRAAIDALFDYGRPRRVQLAVLCDRGHRELPIRPDYVGKNLPTAREQRVNVRLEELDEVDEVTISELAEVGI